jgi:hypothetical protein
MSSVLLEMLQMGCFRIQSTLGRPQKMDLCELGTHFARDISSLRQNQCRTLPHRTQRYFSGDLLIIELQ